MDLLRLLDRLSPIGVIPANYPHFQDLLKQAHIGYTREKRKTIRKVREKVRNPVTNTLTVNVVEVPEVVEWTDWFITYDDKMHPKMTRTPSGRVKLHYDQMQCGSCDHAKFAAILDFIAFRGESNMRQIGTAGALDRANVLDVALGKTAALRLPDGSTVDLGAKVKSLRNKSYREVCTELANMGMKNYARRTVEKSDQSENTEVNTQSVAVSLGFDNEI